MNSFIQSIKFNEQGTAKILANRIPELNDLIKSFSIKGRILGIQTFKNNIDHQKSVLKSVSVMFSGPGGDRDPNVLRAAQVKSLIGYEVIPTVFCADEEDIFNTIVAFLEKSEGAALKKLTYKGAFESCVKALYGENYPTQGNPASLEKLRSEWTRLGGKLSKVCLVLSNTQGEVVIEK